MTLLTKPVRNLFLATMFGIAIGLVETRVQADEFPVCYDEAMRCYNEGGELIPDPEGQYCHGEPGGFILTPFQCKDGEDVIFSGWCFPTNPYGHKISCEG